MELFEGSPLVAVVEVSRKETQEFLVGGRPGVVDVQFPTQLDEEVVKGSGDITTWGESRAFLKHFCRGASHPTTQGGLSNDCFSESSQSTRISPRAKLQVVINWPRLMATSTFAGNGNRGSGSTLRRSTAV